MVYVDNLPQPVPQTVFSKRFHETVGSTGAGKALNLHPLGLDVILHGLVGDDENGRKLQAYLANQNISLIYDNDPDGTKHHINLMDNYGQRISIHVVPGTFEPEIDWTKIEPHIAEANVVALNIINYCRHAIPIIKKYHKPIWCDIHDYDGKSAYHQDFIDAADVILMSSDALPAFRPFMEQQIDNGKELVICTHGRDGATALTASGEWIDVPILDEFERIDTNGAGDSFFAGVLYGRLRNYPIEKCLQVATIVSGLCINSPNLANESLSADCVESLYQKYFEG